MTHAKGGLNKLVFDQSIYINQNHRGASQGLVPGVIGGFWPPIYIGK